MHSSLFPYSPERDAYALLGVPSTASTDEVNAACRRLARAFHPDRNGSSRATAEMAVVNSVRTVMGDPEARAAYDFERRSFHGVRAKVLVGDHAVPSIEPARPAVRPPPPRVGEPDRGPGRYVAGIRAGLLAAGAALLPPRCRQCRGVILALSDAYCVGCGARLPTRD
jgi:curved DNA-binding protein CbpA